MFRNRNGAKIVLSDGREFPCDIIMDNAGDKSIDITRLRAETGFITYDPGFVNTGSCMSSICYINGEEGILRYRGYNIEDLVEKCDFIEVAYLLIKGMLPDGNESVVDATATFSPGEVLFIGDAVQIPLKIKVDRAQERPESRTISFWDEWKSGKTMDLEAGIHTYMKY